METPIMLKKEEIDVINGLGKFEMIAAILSLRVGSSSGNFERMMVSAPPCRLIARLSS